MSCPRCDQPHPDAARFCARCGGDVRATTTELQQRRAVYAAHPGEPLVSFNVVTSLMPLASAKAPQTYKFALAIGLALPAAAALAGLLSLAMACAAVVVPVVYVLYMYDVNEWEDEPVPVVLGAVALAAALAVPFTWLWSSLLGGPIAFVGGDSARVHLRTLVIVALVVPIGTLVLAQVGPLVLATRARFDDLLDALTFGVASGAAFAAVETLVLNRDLLFSGTARYEDPNVAMWLALVLTAGLVKPIIYGAATGIACAGFSGLGEGYDGFTPGYWRRLAEALITTIAFQLGLYLTGLAGGTAGVVLGLVWGLAVAGFVVVRLRFVLHTALLEGALEHAARGSVPSTASRDVAFCSECELPLLNEASFCSACGASVRAASKLTRRANSAPSALQEVGA